MLSQLVGAPSVSSTSADTDRSNMQVIEHLGNWLNDLGFRTKIMPLPGKLDKANLIATLGPATRKGKGGLVLACHTDTVPFDESLQINLRLLPGLDSEEVHAELARSIQNAVADSAVTLTLNKAYPPILPFATPKNGSLAKTLSNLNERTPATVAFGTEAHSLQILGMETAVCGPGSIDQAHQLNEYLAKAHIAPAIATLRQVIQRYCID